MKKISAFPSLLALTICALGLMTCAVGAQQTSQTFGSGANQFTIDFTTIGNAGQIADSATGYGFVPYTFAMGIYAISQNQIDAAAANGLQGVTAGAWSGDRPAANITWYQAAAFVNWLNTSQGYQAAYNLTYSAGAYTMSFWHNNQSGYDPSNPFRNSLALYVLPTENELYKAAYGKSDGSGYYLYATASDAYPTAVASGTAAGTTVFNQPYEQGPASVYEAGGLSSYGTMGQGGNVWQWEESAYDGNNDDTAEIRGLRAGIWHDGGYLQAIDRQGYGDPATEYSNVGFRVASVPEPSTYALLLLSGAASLWALKRRKS